MAKLFGPRMKLILVTILCVFRICHFVLTMSPRKTREQRALKNVWHTHRLKYTHMWYNHDGKKYGGSSEN